MYMQNCKSEKSKRVILEEKIPQESGQPFFYCVLVWCKDKETQHCRGVIPSLPKGSIKCINSSCSSKVSYPSSLLDKEREPFSGSLEVKPLGELGT